MIKHRYILIAFFVFLPAIILGQIQTTTLSPLPFKEAIQHDASKKRNTTQTLFYKIPHEKGIENIHNTKKYQVGKTYQVNYTPENAGENYTTSNGTKIWRIGFYSPGAASISFIFDEFFIPEGAVFFVYNPSQSEILGGFSHINNNQNKLLPVSPLASDTIIIEYQQPANASFQGKLRIGSVTHNEIDFLKSTGTFNSSAKCSPHAAFVQEVENIKQATSLLYITDKDGSWLGSGVMINNTDGKPYLLTAAHNYEGNNIEQSTIFYFNYEVPKADSLIRGSQEFTIGGGILKAKAYDIDFALLELNQMPPADYRPYLAGWNRETSNLAPLVCVHHPQGDVKRVSFDNDEPQEVTYPYNDLLETKVNNGHWKINKWEKGTTEPGSSGSGLFDKEYLIIGGLTGGNSTCSSPINDYFFRLNKAWNHYTTNDSKQLKRWLDPNNSNAMKMYGRDPYASFPCKRISNIEIGDVMGKVSLGNGKTGRLSGHNELLHTEFAEKFVTDTNHYLHGIYIVPFIGKYNANAPITINVYNGKEKPQTLLESVILNPKLLNYSYANNNFNQTNKVQFNNRENYLRFNSPVLVDEEFFVSYSITYQPVDSFAVYMVNNRNINEFNSAYYKEGNSWQSFNNHPHLALSSSLWIEPVIQKADESIIFYPSKEKADAILFPNPCSNYLNVLRKQTSSTEYSIFTIQGTKIWSQQSIDNPLTIDASSLPKGIYFLQIATDNQLTSYKFIKH